MKPLGIVLLVVVFYSCSRTNSPASILDRERFAAVYMELLDSAQITQRAPSDSAINQVAARILQRHDVTLEDFRATVKNYSADSKNWKEFYENIVKRIDERAQKNTPTESSNPQ